MPSFKDSENAQLQLQRHHCIITITNNPFSPEIFFQKIIWKKLQKSSGGVRTTDQIILLIKEKGGRERIWGGEKKKELLNP